MPSSLKRWLHKRRRLTSLDPRPPICETPTDGPKPTVTPARCICDKLASEFAKYRTKIQGRGEEALEASQRDALHRWHAFPFELGINPDKNPLPLDHFLRNPRRVFLPRRSAPAHDCYVGRRYACECGLGRPDQEAKMERVVRATAGPHGGETTA